MRYIRYAFSVCHNSSSHPLAVFYKRDCDQWQFRLLETIGQLRVTVDRKASLFSIVGRRFSRTKIVRIYRCFVVREAVLRFSLKFSAHKVTSNSTYRMKCYKSATNVRLGSYMHIFVLMIIFL